MAENLKDTIKEKIDLLEFLSSKGITWTNQSSNPKALCVFHEEKTPSFTLSKDRKRYKCYGCNESGDVFDYLMSAEKLTFVEAIRQLSSYLSLEYDDNSFSDEVEKRKKVKIINNEAFLTRDSFDKFIPGKIKPPTKTLFFTTSKVVAVPKSITILSEILLSMTATEFAILSAPI